MIYFISTFLTATLLATIVSTAAESVKRNTAPTISDIAARTINPGSSTGALAFTIGDAQTAASALKLSASSSNTKLVPKSKIIFGGSGKNRTVTVTPMRGRTGSATIKVTVSDGKLSRSDAFVLTVIRNTAPTISDIAAQTINKGGHTDQIAFKIGDAETAASSLTLSGSSSNTSLAPNANILFGGIGANRTVTVIPVSGQSGAATITVMVSDGSLITSRTFVLTMTGMTVLGVLPDHTNSSASGVSADGSVVVGQSYDDSGKSKAFRWTAAEGMVDLGVLPGHTNSSASGVSADGSVVVGFNNKDDWDYRAFRWTAAVGMVDLGVLPSCNNSFANGVSADGSVVVGGSSDDESGKNKAFRWSAAQGMVDIGALPDHTNSSASSVSADGSVVVGQSYDDSGKSKAFRWTAAEGMVDLGVLPLGVLPDRTNSYASGVSADGSVVVGQSYDGSGKSKAFRWTAAEGMVDLGVLPGCTYSFASSFSADGSVVVGFSHGPGHRAFRWTAAEGMVDLGALPSDDVPYSSYEATYVSAERSIVIGKILDDSASLTHYRAFRWLAPITPTNMALIPQGAFTMGNSVAADTDITDAPTRTVTLDAFYIGKYEVSKAEWDEVRTWGLSNGYTDLAAGTGKASNHPVHSISWYDMVKWCNARSQREELTPVYYTNDAQTSIYKTGSVDVTNVQVKWTANGYRLPTEAEWEKAARGGLSGKRFPWGDTISHSQANYYANGTDIYDLGKSGYHSSYTTNAMPYLSPIGSYAANGYGLHDVAGNVFEWCWDWYAMYSTGSQINPRGPATGIAGFGTGRALRSGSWGAYASYSRSAYRDYINPSSTGYTGIGFRVARSSPP